MASKKYYEDIALQLLKSILASKQRMQVLEAAIEMYETSEKGLAKRIIQVREDMLAGVDSIDAFHGSGMLTDETYELLKMLFEKSVLGLPVINIMIENNRNDAMIMSKTRKMLIQPLISLSVGVLIGNYMIVTGVGVVRDNKEANIELSFFHTFVADHVLMSSLLILAVLIPLVIMGLYMFFIKTGGIYQYLYKTNTMIYFLRKAKTPFREIFTRAQFLLPRGSRPRKIMENAADEIQTKKFIIVIKEYLKLYPLEIMSTKMTQMDRGEDVDSFKELAKDSLDLYNNYATAISSSLPTFFLVLTFGYIFICMMPMGSFLSSVMGKM